MTLQDLLDKANDYGFDPAKVKITFRYPVDVESWGREHQYETDPSVNIETNKMELW